MASFRMATVQARENPLRFDCVSAVDSLSEDPNRIFRGQLLLFFKLPAKDIRLAGVGALATELEDLNFALLGCFRSIRHEPYLCEEAFHDGKTATREKLLGGPGHFLIAFPPNHIEMKASYHNEWQAARFKIVQLCDLKGSAHIIPLTNREGGPLKASYVRDANMHGSIPGATFKQLFYLNTCVY